MSAAEGGAAPLAMTPEAFRAAGHRLIDGIADYLAELAALPVAPDATPAEIRALLGEKPLPETGGDAAALLERALALLVGHNRLTAHPRQWGYIIGAAAPAGALADLIAAAVNTNPVAWASAPLATEMELQAVRWLAELVGFPASGGLFTAGGNAANFIGFLAARRARAGFDVRRLGTGGARLVCYASRETHTWIEKAADLFGLGTEAIRWIATDAEQRLVPEALERAIVADRAAGLTPFVIVGNAGTVSTGAVDPLPRMAAIARAHDLWFHVDGAYGAPAIVVPGTPADLAALAQADSLAIDAHKWLHAPLEAGCALVRERHHLTDAFAYRPPYYEREGFAGEELVDFHEMGLQNSRAFRALKVWIGLAVAGRAGYRAMIARDLALAQRLYDRLRATPEIEALTLGLSVVTFRYAPEGLAETALEAINRALVTRIQRSGEAYVSNAVVGGRFALRACITNFRTSEADVDALPGIVRRLGARVRAELAAR